MVTYAFITLKDENLVLRFDISSGLPKDRVDYKIPGGPAPLNINPAKTRLFVGLRDSNELGCIKINKDASLTLASTSPLPTDPCYVAIDKKGQTLFTSYYKAGQVAVHHYDEKNDTMTETQRITTDTNAHSVWVASGNKHIFVPHTAANKIFLFNFDSNSGKISPNTPPWFTPDKHLEPRHMCFHPKLDLMYSVNEGSSTVSVYDLDQKNGILKCKQTLSTLPEQGIKDTITAEIRITPNGKFLYATNRGHNSLACYTVDGTAGTLKFNTTIPAPTIPRVFDISPDGSYLYAAGQSSGELATYEINQDTGILKELSRFYIGKNPMWILPVVWA